MTSTPHSGVVDILTENNLALPSPAKAFHSATENQSSPLKPSHKENKMNQSQMASPSKWEHISDLDETERWLERTTILTKAEHEFYMTCAQNFLDSIIDDVCSQSKGGNPPVNNDLHYMDEFGDEHFQNTSTNFDLDYLENISTRNETAAASALARQSLYVKFDPLVGGESSGRVPEQPRVVPQAKLPPNSDLMMLNTPPPGENKRKKPSKSRVHFASPQKKDLLTYAPESSLVEHDLPSEHSVINSEDSLHVGSDATNQGELVKVLKFSEEDVSRMIEAALQQERQLNSRGSDDSKRHLQDQLNIANLEKEGYKVQGMLMLRERTVLENELQKWKSAVVKLEESQQSTTMKYKSLKEQVTEVQKQRDQALSEFESVEMSFGDLHTRYMKVKEISQALKKRESTLQDLVSNMEKSLKEGEDKMSALREEMQRKQNEVNIEFQKLKDENSSKMAGMSAQMKKLTLENANLKRAIQQKEQEKAELAAICDELVNEMGKGQS